MNQSIHNQIEKTLEENNQNIQELKQFVLELEELKETHPELWKLAVLGEGNIKEFIILEKHKRFEELNKHKAKNISQLIKFLE